jgi:hypothetical protein
LLRQKKPLPKMNHVYSTRVWLQLLALALGFPLLTINFFAFLQDPAVLCVRVNCSDANQTATQTAMLWKWQLLSWKIGAIVGLCHLVVWAPNLLPDVRHVASMVMRWVEKQDQHFVEAGIVKVLCGITLASGAASLLGQPLLSISLKLAALGISGMALVFLPMDAARATRSTPQATEPTPQAAALDHQPEE